MCSARKFCSEFFTHISEHFRAYFRLHRADVMNWASLERSFPPAEVDYRSGQGLSQAVTGNTGVNGLKYLVK